MCARNTELYPTNLPRRYQKCYEELIEFLNMISSTLREVEDEGWRKKLAEMCILVLGFQELPEIRSRLKNGNEKPYCIE